MFMVGWMAAFAPGFAPKLELCQNPICSGFTPKFIQQKAPTSGLFFKCKCRPRLQRLQTKKLFPNPHNDLQPIQNGIGGRFEKSPDGGAVFQTQMSAFATVAN